MSGRALVVAVVLVTSTASAVPSGRKWFFPACGAGCPATMTCVNNRCTPQVRFAATIDNTGGTVLNGGVTLATFLQRAPEAFRSWTTPRVSSCATTWDVTFGQTFSTPSETAAMSSTDGRNSVIWLTGSAWRYSAATLALTTTNFYTGTNEIFDADMELNNNVAWDTTGTVSSAYDLESVIVHEAGHFLGLDHTPLSFSAVMFPTVTPGSPKRALADADTGDVCAVYPGGAGTIGSRCATGTECTGGLVCEGAPGATQLSCVQDCASAGAACPSGYTCRASTAGFACLPQVGVPDQCKFCSSGQECSSGLCVLADDFTTYCSLNCVDNSQCGPGYTCTATASGRLCLTNTRCTNQCTTPATCGVDYACTGGTCIPGGAVGNRCEISGFCNACNTCVTSGAAGSIAFCRQCCGANAAGGTQCTTCSNTTCGTGLSCAGLGSGDSACIAQTGPGLCQTCGAGDTCAQGFVCVAGRCHATCNPSAPGTCVACLGLTSGGGACACPDEVAGVGEACGSVGGTVAGCTQGLACVGSPQTFCRARCDLAHPESCPVGESCQLANGVAVCLPGAAGNTCAACTNAGTCNNGLSCYLGRCYATCNVNVASSCGTCVQTELSGAGVCGCPDQVANANEPCGTQAEVRACASGNVCLEGFCREPCDPVNPSNCPNGTECRAAGTGAFCQIAQATGGGGGQAAGGGRPDAGRGGGAGGGGGGGGSVTSLGCGCATMDAGWCLAGLGLLAVRRRAR